MADDTGHDLVGSERDVLLYYLNKMRDAVVRASEGLTDEQQRMFAGTWPFAARTTTS